MIYKCVCICEWRPEINIGCLPKALSTLVFETKSFAESPAYQFGSKPQGILLSPPPQKWDYRCTPLQPVFSSVAESKLWSSYLHSKQSTNKFLSPVPAQGLSLNLELTSLARLLGSKPPEQPLLPLLQF